MKNNNPAIDIITALKTADNEFTEAPYWLILDPGNPCSNINVLAGRITGIFFSREDAEEYLKITKYNYSDRAEVFCMSGYQSEKYRMFYQTIRGYIQHKEEET